MSLKFENLKDWFSAFYQVILGQDQVLVLVLLLSFTELKNHSLVRGKAIR